jgi:hypothetical protein
MGVELVVGVIFIVGVLGIVWIVDKVLGPAGDTPAH